MKLTQQERQDNEIESLRNFNTTWDMSSIGDGGIAGADAMCADTSDSNHPDDGNTYKAMIVDGTNRIACTTANCGGGTSESTDWILHASTDYVRSNGSTAIMTTNANGVFAFGTLDNAISASSLDIWTGLDTDWTTISNDCTNWTVTSGSGQAAEAEQTSSSAISSFSASCTNTYRIYCVQQ